MSITLVTENKIQSKLNPSRKLIFSELKSLLPSAMIEEIGSTSIPGALTKGDLDVLAIVDESIFKDSVRLLEERYEINEMEPLPLFASFKGNIAGVDLGIQLDAQNDNNFRFIAFRDSLLNSPELVKKYNQIKETACALSTEEYRRQKNLFIETIISDYA